MSELVVFKSNELAVSRYDLTEHETKLILCCVSLLNPAIENPSENDRTVDFSYQQYAQMMGLSLDNAYQRLKSSTRNLLTRTVEIIYPTGAISQRIFQWVNYAEFNRETQSLKLIFSPHILPYLFQLKKFIKYNLIHVRDFENKYSMRVYEWLLKELTQRKTHKANIEISITDFKFMLMLEKHKSYEQFFEFKRKIITPITKDLNTYSNMRLNIEKRGRPADTLIFQVELGQQIDLVTELANEDPNPARKTRPIVIDNLHNELQKTLALAQQLKIHLSSFESKFLNDMNSKYNTTESFHWLTQKQKDTLTKILTKYNEISMDFFMSYGDAK